MASQFGNGTLYTNLLKHDYHGYVVTQSNNLGSIREEIKANVIKSG
jgi:hypothetical protein